MHTLMITPHPLTNARNLIPSNVHCQMSHLRSHPREVDQPLHIAGDVTAKLLLQDGCCPLQVLHFILGGG